MKKPSKYYFFLIFFAAISFYNTATAKTTVSSPTADFICAHSLHSGVDGQRHLFGWPNVISWQKYLVFTYQNGIVVKSKDNTYYFPTKPPLSHHYHFVFKIPLPNQILFAQVVRKGKKWRVNRLSLNRNEWKSKDKFKQKQYGKNQRALKMKPLSMVELEQVNQLLVKELKTKLSLTKNDFEKSYLVKNRYIRFGKMDSRSASPEATLPDFDKAISHLNACLSGNINPMIKILVNSTRDEFIEIKNRREKLEPPIKRMATFRAENDMGPSFNYSKTSPFIKSKDYFELPDALERTKSGAVVKRYIHFKRKGNKQPLIPGEFKVVVTGYESTHAAKSSYQPNKNLILEDLIIYSLSGPSDMKAYIENVILSHKSRSR